MADEKFAKLVEATEKLSNDLDLQVFRPLQVKAWECSIDCAKKKGSSQQAFQACVDQCHGRAHESQQKINTELAQFQERLQRCFGVCRDKAASILQDDEKNMPAAQKTMEACSVDCLKHSEGEFTKLATRLLKQYKP